MGRQQVWRWKRPLYLMAKPPKQVRAELVRLCAMLGIEITYSPERWHSTFLPVGEHEAATIDAVRRALKQFEAEPFTTTYDHVEGDTLKPRKGQRAPGMFQRALARHIAAAGVPSLPYDFGLHLNLKYGGRSDRRAAIRPIIWPVSELLLIESTGGRHIEHGRWLLQSRQLPLAF